MQTFLPYPNFSESAKVLDYRRLGKQRVETLQILNCLLSGSSGWINHPAVKMWRNYEGSLIQYGESICEEWIKRGYKDSCLAKISNFRDKTNNYLLPFWIGDIEFHKSHRSNLLRKDYTYYSKFWPNEQSDLPYIWPV